MDHQAYSPGSTRLIISPLSRDTKLLAYWRGSHRWKRLLICLKRAFVGSASVRIVR